jgi:hypothetical protein
VANKSTLALQRKTSSTKQKNSSSTPSAPWWWKQAGFIIGAAVLLLYLPTVKLGYTQLDDSIFIQEQKEYNENLSNLIVSFERGVFHPTKDVYYRPVLLDSFILNHFISGENIADWHLVNVLLHLAAVLLLFRLLKKLQLTRAAVFLLTMFFAVHPVLAQAVAWIPGRNDTLLAIFVFSFFHAAMEFAATKKAGLLMVQWLLLLLALFTKETAVFAAPAAAVILVMLMKQKFFSKPLVILYASWLVAGLVWLLARSQASLEHSQLQVAEMAAAFPSRLIVLVHYLGKIVLPVQLSVFPIVEDTPVFFGIAGWLLISVLVFLGKGKNKPSLLAGIFIYVLFFIPALLVPESLNDQDFEHRTYLPMLGFLLVLGESILFRNHWKEGHILSGGIVIVLVLAVINWNHQKKFSDPVTFWTAAVETSPNSAYANMMLGARIDETDKPRSDQLIRKAYRLNPEQKYINYYMGVVKQTNDSILASEVFFLKELEISDYYQCYFHLARVAFEKKDQAMAIAYLEKYISRNAGDGQANHNLLLLYVETGQLEKARSQLQKMKNAGLEIPQGMEERLK